jgi:hypothetical protein
MQETRDAYGVPAALSDARALFASNDYAFAAAPAQTNPPSMPARCRQKAQRLHLAQPGSAHSPPLAALVNLVDVADQRGAAAPG